MADFLTTYLQIIPASQKLKLLDVIKASETKVTDYNSSIADSLLSEDYQRITQYTKQPNYMSSEEYNKMIAGIYGDLSLLYNYVGLTDVFLLNNKILDMSDFSVIENELAKIKSQITSLSAKMQSTKTTSVFIDTFITTGSTETKNPQTEHLFTDRDGRSVKEMTDINTEQSCCTLPVDWSINAFRDNTGGILAKISYQKTPANAADIRSHIYLDKNSHDLVPNTDFTLAKSIDESIETYWKENIEADEALKLKIGNTTTSGMTVVFEITLDTPTNINGISLTPFATYPMDLVSVEVMKDIQPSTTSTLLTGSAIPFITTTQFIKIAPTVVKKIIVTLRQQNYEIVSYKAKKSKLSARQSWTKLNEGEPVLAKEIFEQ